MKKSKKVISLLMATVILLSGCGSSKSDTTTGTNSKEYVYKTEDIEFTGDASNISFDNFLFSNNQMYAYAYTWGETENTLNFYSMDSNNDSKLMFQLQNTQNANIYNICMDENQNIYAINDVYGTSDDELGIPTDAEEYFLEKYDANGNKLSEINLSTLKEINTDPDVYFYVNQLYLTENNKLLLQTNDRIAIFDLDLNYEKQYNLNDTVNEDYGYTMSQLYDKRVVIQYQESYDSNMIIAFLDTETGKLSGNSDFPGTSYGYTFYPSIKYDFTLSNNQCHLVNQFQIKIQWFSFRESHCFFSSKT